MHMVSGRLITLKDFLIPALLIFMCGAGFTEGRYGDVNSALVDLIRIQETYIAAIKNARGEDDVANAITYYTDEFTQIKPRIESFELKYPELRSSKEPPEELKATFNRLQESATRMADISSIMIKYFDKPKVQKAIERLKALATPGNSKTEAQAQPPQNEEKSGQVTPK